MTDSPFGYTSSGSTHRQVNLVASLGESNALPAVGRMVYMDSEVDGTKYRSVGTITQMETSNDNLKDSSQQALMARSGGRYSTTADLRLTQFSIQATFRFDATSGQYVRYSAGLPTSPDTRSQVNFLNEEVVRSMMPTGSEFACIGYFQGMDGVPQGITVPDFGGRTGARSSAVLGQSGSGKSSMYTLMLGAYMKHEQHAILVIDPQGQWSNENGMIFSPQNFAKSLGREVRVVRVAEEIQLPVDEEIVSRMMTKLGVLDKGFRRMGSENKEALAEEIVSRLIRNRNNFSRDAREVLTEIFDAISKSPSTLARIYASDDRRVVLKQELMILAGTLVEDENGDPIMFSEEDKEDQEANWSKILEYFVPLQSLFSNKNLSGGKRQPLAGEGGFMSDFFKVRTPNSEPAPYVIFDMTPNRVAHAQAKLLGKDSDSALRAAIGMQKMLDREEVKAMILMLTFQEMKAASEEVFATTPGANLNTQIVFDEAWRFANRRKSASEEVEKLATMLEGFALDTRKFGIGWTYILQTPSDLREGIWRQVAYTYVGYGLRGEDIRTLQAQTDDTKQVDLYTQFIDPGSTRVYPFMFMGPLSPIIFTESPMFLNIFSGPDEFIQCNKAWIDQITTNRGLPQVTSEMLGKKVAVKKSTLLVAPAASYSVGKKEDTMPSAKPQTVPSVTSSTTPDEPAADEFPF